MAGLKTRYVQASFIAATVLAVDQGSKLLVLHSLAPGETRSVIPGLFNLVLTFNRGGLFGFLNQEAFAWQRFLFIALSFVALGLILYLIRTLHPRDILSRIGLGLVMGGAIGNLADRIRLGHVVDFLDFYLGNAHWPAFNAADSAISVGVGLVFLALLFQPRSSD